MKEPETLVEVAPVAVEKSSVSSVEVLQDSSISLLKKNLSTFILFVQSWNLSTSFLFVQS